MSGLVESGDPRLSTSTSSLEPGEIRVMDTECSHPSTTCLTSAKVIERMEALMDNKNSRKGLERQRHHHERLYESKSPKRHSYTRDTYRVDMRSESPERAGSRSRSRHRRRHSRSRSKSKSRSRSRSPLIHSSRTKPTSQQRHTTTSSTSTLHQVDSSETHWLNELPTEGAVTTNLKLMTYDTMTGRLLLSKGKVQRFELETPKINLNHRELLFRIVWHRPPPKPDSMSDEEYLRTRILLKLTQSWAHKYVSWIAMDCTYLFPSSPFTIVIQFQPGSSKQYSPLCELLKDLNSGLRAGQYDALGFIEHQQAVISAKRPEFFETCCTYFFRILPIGGRIQGCRYQSTVGGCRKSHQIDRYQQYITQMLHEAGAPIQITTVAAQLELKSSKPIGDSALDHDFRLRTYDTTSGRIIFSKSQDQMIALSIRFEVIQPRINLDHRELLFRVVWHQPPTPLNGLDMTNSAHDEAYLRQHIVPYLSQFPTTRNHIHWVAVERQFLLLNSTFNIIIQFHPGFVPSHPYPPGDLLSCLNCGSSNSNASSFSRYQLRFGATKNDGFQWLCHQYFVCIGDGDGMAKGCQIQVKKGHTCFKSHAIQSANQLIHQLLIEAGAPLQPLPPITLEQPDIELETFETCEGVLTVPTGGTSLDQTKYEPNYVIATHDSEAIIHRLVWMDTSSDSLSLDRLATIDDRVHDLRAMLRRLSDDRTKHLLLQHIQWIARITNPEGRPTNFILIQCHLHVNVTVHLSNWNREFKFAGLLQPFLEWWLYRLPRYPDLYQQMCPSRWIFIRRGDGRLVHGCGSTNHMHGCGRSHEPQFMEEFIQRERESVTILTKPTNQIVTSTSIPFKQDYLAPTVSSHQQPMDESDHDQERSTKRSKHQSHEKDDLLSEHSCDESSTNETKKSVRKHHKDAKKNRKRKNEKKSSKKKEKKKDLKSDSTKHKHKKEKNRKRSRSSSEELSSDTESILMELVPATQISPSPSISTTVSTTLIQSSASPPNVNTLNHPSNSSHLTSYDSITSQISEAQINGASSTIVLSPWMNGSNLSPPVVGELDQSVTHLPPITNSASPTPSLVSPRPSPTPIEARHPYYYSYPIGSVLIDSNLNSIGVVITQPPLQPFTSAVNEDLNLYVPTGGLFESRFRSEWSETGQLSNDSRVKDAIICLNKFKESRLLTSEMDLLLVQRINPEKLLLHFRSYGSLIKLSDRFKAKGEGRPLSPVPSVNPFMGVVMNKFWHNENAAI